MSVTTGEKSAIFFGDNLDVVNFWVHQIILCKSFYIWLKSLVELRYKVKSKED